MVSWIWLFLHKIRKSFITKSTRHDNQPKNHQITVVISFSQDSPCEALSSNLLASCSNFSWRSISSTSATSRFRSASSNSRQTASRSCSKRPFGGMYGLDQIVEKGYTGSHHKERYILGQLEKSDSKPFTNHKNYWPSLNSWKVGQYPHHTLGQYPHHTHTEINGRGPCEPSLTS